MSKRFIYVISCGNRLKIGYSTNPNERLKQLQTSNSEKLVLEWSRERADACQLEKHLHRTFNKHHIRGEWFDATTLTIGQIRSTSFGYIKYDW